ncbi:MAG: serine--tRNA ligase [Candidatus Margulisbacteria bacterium GWF2_35_9]|nr:MAG: serine--tRNA ligase [Candidatus Margulisbacteria bacterium GWF2_35_9]
MLAAKYIRENEAEVRQMLLNRKNTTDVLDNWLSIDGKCRELAQESERLKAERNSLKPKGKPSPELMEQLKTLSERIKIIDDEAKEFDDKQAELIMYIPNVFSEDTPIGTDETANKELSKWGTPREFSFKAKSHDEIGVALGILDFQRGVKISGSRFTIYRGWGAKLERALINFMLDTHSAEGYQEILPPFLVNREAMTGTGQLPKFEEDLYKCENENLFLIPTAEVPVTNMYQNEILEEKELPQKFVAYTPCFRREAGSYGKDTAGLIRQHQFNKVELVMYTTPQDSEKMLEVLTGNAEKILQLLELPYRKIQLCSGDLGFSSGKTYDLEVWLPSQNTYREISSCSNFYNFQAKRAMIRYRNVEKKVENIHTLNGSGLAVGRTFAAILENYQQEDGSIKIPSVLQDYLKIEIIKI